jgi:hypothetical protein
VDDTDSVTLDSSAFESVLALNSDDGDSDVEEIVFCPRSSEMF